MPRAQTTLDFLVGTTVFLLTLSAVLVTIPGLVDPFATGQESNTITADRAAEALATDVLVTTPSKPYVFDNDTVHAFFEPGPSESQPKQRLGVPAGVNMNVTLNSTATPGKLWLGPNVPEGAETSVAWRSGTLQGNYTEIVVRVW